MCKCKYISLGEIHAYYKYIYFYIISHFINKYLFKKDVLSKIGEFSFPIISSHMLIKQILMYVLMFFISIFLFFYEEYQKKKKGPDYISKKRRKTTFKLIYKNQLEGKVSIIKILLIIFVLVIETELQNTFYAVGFDGLDYWMFELLFIYYISSSMLSTPMYAHQKYSMFFIFIFCSLMKTISIILNYFDERNKIYKTYNVFIPIGLLIYILISFLRAYVVCKLKWCMDLKYISSGKLLMFYGIIGAIITSGACVITSIYPCEDTLISYKEMTNICRQNIPYNNGTHNITYNYYDSYQLFVKQLLDKDKLYTFKNTCLLFLRTTIFFFIKFFSMQIIKYLSPAFFICASYLYYFFLRLVNIIIDLIKNNDIESYNYLDFIIEIFSIVGILVYIEFIELNFCDLNYNLKKNIIQRSLIDSKNTEIAEITDDDIEEGGENNANVSNNTINEENQNNENKETNENNENMFEV